jgi:multiple sugar transport system permease protein
MATSAADVRIEPSVSRWLRAPSVRTSVVTAVALVAVFVIVFPFLWIVVSSFRDPENFLTLHLGDAIPHSPGIASYRLALGETDLLRWIGNSLLVAAATTLLSLAVAAPAAFALVRLRFRARGFASLYLVVAYAVPSITLAVPLFVILVKLHLNDTYWGLVIVHASFTIPFATWVLSDFYRSLPQDLEEAGYVDGASLASVLRHIVLPLSVPGLLAAGAYSFILSWNDFLFALVIMNSNDHFTAPVGIHAYFTGRSITPEVWAELMAASTLVTLPSVILFGFFQRYMVSGFLSGAVKG